MPDHLHLVWTLPPGDSDFSTRIGQIKGRFSRWVGRTFERSPSKLRAREAGLWQRRFWEHAVRSEAEFRFFVEYCWHDPVRHGLVQYPGEWLYSSFHRDLRLGNVPANWQDKFAGTEFGERRPLPTLPARIEGGRAAKPATKSAVELSG